MNKTVILTKMKNYKKKLYSGVLFEMNFCYKKINKININLIRMSCTKYDFLIKN